jgi:hypothetical protein
MSDADSLRNQLYDRLRPSLRRLQARAALSVLNRALPWAATLGASLRALQVVTGHPNAATAFLVALVPFVVQALRALRRPIGWKATARVIDDRFALADRTLSAVSLAADGELSPIAQLQVRDTLRCLQPVDLRPAVKLNLPPRSLALAIVFVLSLFGTYGNRPMLGWAAPRVRIRPLSTPRAPFESVPSVLSTQPAATGQTYGPMALQERKETSHLGDNASVRRYFEHRDRQPAPTVH